MNEKMSILIVDDERIVRESFFHWFEKSGHMVDTASSGSKALEKLEKLPFELLFVDIKMPGMNGIELLGRVKEEYPDTIVIIMTAYGTTETAIEGVRIDADLRGRQQDLIGGGGHLSDRRHDTTIVDDPQLEDVSRRDSEVGTGISIGAFCVNWSQRVDHILPHQRHNNAAQGKPCLRCVERYRLGESDIVDGFTRKQVSLNNHQIVLTAQDAIIIAASGQAQSEQCHGYCQQPSTSHSKRTFA